MADFKNYITPRGYKRLRDEHLFLRVVERPRVVDEVAYAASLGDRSENAEYIYGKRRLREIDRRLRWLHKRLAAAEIVEPSIDRGEVIFFGATVTLLAEDGSERRLELVGEDEIETELGRISWRSPLGAALMRKREGDTVRFAAPERTRGHDVLEVAEVRYERQVPDPEPTRWDRHQQEMRERGLTVAPPAILDLPEGLEDDDDGPEARPLPTAAPQAPAAAVAPSKPSPPAVPKAASPRPPGQVAPTKAALTPPATAPKAATPAAPATAPKAATPAAPATKVARKVAPKKVAKAPQR
jgi:transcription elongation factor GreB